MSSKEGANELHVTISQFKKVARAKTNCFFVNPDDFETLCTTTGDDDDGESRVKKAAVFGIPCSCNGLVFNVK